MVKYDIISVGSAVIDAFVETKLREKNHEMFLPVGAKLLVEHLGFATGGGGTNAATAFSKMGFKAGFLGKLGKDANAEIILSEMKKNNVDFLGVRGKEPTGYSVIIDSKFRDRTILTYRGANENLKFSDLKLSKLNAKWYYFATMNEASLDAQVKIAEFVFKKGAKIVYNPGSSSIVNDRKKVLRILRMCEIVVVNDSEATELVGTNEEAAFERIRKLGPRIVAITYGEHGSKVYDGNFLFKSEANEVNVVERTGAGDAFCAGFVAAFLKLDDIEQAVRIGAINSESVIQHKGAKVGLLSWWDAFANINKIKIRVKRI